MRKRKNYKLSSAMLLLVIPIVATIVSWSIYKKINTLDSVPTFANKNSYKIEALTVYSIQVGALTDKNQTSIVVKDLEENRIPNYIVTKGNLNKINSYMFLDKEQTRSLLEDVRGNYSDAFLVTSQIPAINLSYSKEHSYLRDVGKKIDLILENMKKESNFWYSYREGNLETEEYLKIIEERKNILDEMKQYTMNIDKEETKEFNANLLVFINNVREKIDTIDGNMQKQDMFSCEKIYIDSIFEYLKFVESLRKRS
ncbi:SPOR domain-containing protein [Alkalithermobacter paradoxus]|uniref:Uncharacterized protein n=1 Tax=Alkalithermobacter paradoxus TaxID=29349 RepID=A0A1V4I6K7_9FIRM|nr:hypothetical protein CLOTH_12770 [[Clostridium] thermoalcaliphilum]